MVQTLGKRTNGRRTQMKLNKVTIIGGGVLGSQIGLMCAYVGKDVTH
jgi:glycerol-3-phosphate dehydrogenase